MFTKATPVQKKLKILLFGGSGTGKTLAALSFPRPAVVDAENGTDLYAGRPNVPSFSVLRIKTFEELQKALDYIKGDKGKSFDTLVIDSISVFYDVQKEAASKTSKDNELGYREWAKINNRMVYLYNALTNLPVHVVVIAREAIEYETKSGNLTRVGFKPDADKRLVYMFDFIIRMKEDHSGEVIKSRGASQLKNMPQVNWQAFAKIADMFNDGQTVPAIDEDAAAQRDSVAFVDTPPAPAAKAPVWWPVLAEYKPFMDPADFDKMCDELRADVKSKVINPSGMEEARKHIENNYRRMIDMDAKRTAEKEAS